MAIVFTRTMSQQIDREAITQLQIPGLLLMENAARGLANQLMNRITKNSRIVILAGRGNNGGDGLALARQLAAIDVDSKVFLFTSGRELSADAYSNLNFLKSTSINVHENPDLNQVDDALQSLQSSDWIVDALFGTGLTGAPRAPFDQIISAANQSQASILAVDVPSGLDCDTGSRYGETIQATLTVTFVALKAGYLQPNAKSHTGDCVVEHIGLPTKWVRTWYQSQNHIDR